MSNKTYERTCPTCNKIIFYKSYGSFWSANNKNCECRDCGFKKINIINSIQRNKYSENLINKSVERNIKVLGIYSNANSKIDFQCLICSHIWSTRPNTIIRGAGCPKCANVLNYSNEYIDEKILNRSISRLEDYINMQFPIKWKCLIKNCEYIWSTTPSSIINNGRGCGKCANNIMYSNEEFDKKISNSNIERIDDYTGGANEIRFKCLNCCLIFKSRPTNILHGSGCRYCNLPGKNEQLMHKILNLNKIDYIPQFRIKNIDLDAKPYIIDAYIPHVKIAIEYNGKQHYEPTGFGSNSKIEIFEIQKNRDEYVRNFCKKNNIILIEIDGRIFKSQKLEKLLIEEIIPKLNEK